MKPIEKAEKQILDKMKTAAKDYRERIKPGVQMCLGILSAVAEEPDREIVVHCEACRYAYISLHEKDGDYSYYCAYHNIDIKPANYCCWAKKKFTRESK